MIELQYIVPNDHYPSLYSVMQKADPVWDTKDFGQFVLRMEHLRGWAVVANGKPIGMMGVTNIVPNHDAVIHGAVLPEWRGKWITRKNLETFFGMIFNKLRLVRVSGYVIVGLTDPLERFFLHLGFEREGYQKKKVHVLGKFWDIIPFGMLKEKCRWLPKKQGELKCQC